jgi:hypothetical protein
VKENNDKNWNRLTDRIRGFEQIGARSGTTPFFMITSQTKNYSKLKQPLIVHIVLVSGGGHCMGKRRATPNMDLSRLAPDEFQTTTERHRDNNAGHDSAMRNKSFLATMLLSQAIVAAHLYITCPLPPPRPVSNLHWNTIDNRGAWHWRAVHLILFHCKWLLESH